jgi:putative addiction module component (TIGR02574 family)
MTTTFDEMSLPERVLHVQDLWDEIARHPEGLPVPEEVKAELRRRLVAHQADPSTSVPWEQVKAEIARRR